MLDKGEEKGGKVEGVCRERERERVNVRESERESMRICYTLKLVRS